jgi:hypothetical protein
MRWLLSSALLVLALLAAGGAQAAVPSITVDVEPTLVKTKLGENFSLRSTITNNRPRPAVGLVAHLNILSLRPGLYVDPEDWSESRTRYLAPIPAGGATTITWTVKAVNSGTLGVYVAVFPSTGSGRPITGPTLRADIAERQTIDAGGIVPLALGVPALLGALAVGIRLRRRR